jgi:hypothetical protein
MEKLAEVETPLGIMRISWEMQNATQMFTQRAVAMMGEMTDVIEKAIKELDWEKIIEEYAKQQFSSILKGQASRIIHDIMGKFEFREKIEVFVKERLKELILENG